MSRLVLVFPVVAVASVLACETVTFEAAPPGAGGGGGADPADDLVKREVPTADGASAGGAGGAGGAQTVDEPEGPPFPATDVLDDFEVDELGGEWSGATAAYSVFAGALSCDTCYPSLLWDEEFSRNQEVFAELEGFSPESPEINVVLLAQDPSCEQLEVSYKPESEAIFVYSCVSSDWSTLGVFDVEVAPGQRLGGRVVEEGRLDVYVDDVRIGSVDIASYPHESGKIGVNGVAIGEANAYADFGGGEY